MTNERRSMKPKRPWSAIGEDVKKAPPGPVNGQTTGGYQNWLHEQGIRPGLKTLFSSDVVNREQFESLLLQTIKERGPSDHFDTIELNGSEYQYDMDAVTGVEFTEVWKRIVQSHGEASQEIAPEKSHLDDLKNAETTTGVLITVHRERNEKGLHPDAQPRVSAFAATDREAFDQLLALSGLDAMEIAEHDLTYERTEGPAGLIEALRRITGDTYDMEMGEIRLPLIASVRSILNKADRP